MTGRLAFALKQKAKEIRLRPSRGGCFEITVDGKLLYSKLATGEFPDEDEIIQSIVNRTY